MTRSVFVAGGGGRPRSSPPPAAVLPPRPLLLLLLPLLLQVLASLPSSHASLTVASALTHPGLLDAGGIDAHGSIAYVAGEGVTAIDVTDPDSPKVLMTLADPLLTECKSVYAYTTAGEQDAGVTAGTTKKRLAVACSGSDALILVDAEAPEDLKLLGSVAEPAALKGAAGVVVKGTLAFVAASGAARVVCVDVSRESRPAVLSSVRLSAASTVGLHGDSHLNVGSGPGRRVTILSYTPSGVLMKTGSVKDGRLEGQRSIVHVYAPNPNITFAVTAANGGTFAVINTTVRTRPTVATALQAAGRAAASVPLVQADAETEEQSGGGAAGASWSPNGHKALEGASGLALASNGVAYVTGSASGSVAAIDAVTDPTRPEVAREITDERLAGVTDLCAAGGDAGSGAAAEVAGTSGDGALVGAGAAVIFAIVPRSMRLVVLRDSWAAGDGDGKKRRSEL